MIIQELCMTLTTNLYKKVRDATIVILLIVLCVTFVSTCRTGQTGEYDNDGNTARIEQQYEDIRELVGGIASGLNSLENETRDSRERIDYSIGELRQFIVDDRKLGDTSIELGIISDRSGRLIKELERRELEKAEED